MARIKLVLNVRTDVFKRHMKLKCFFVNKQLNNISNRKSIPIKHMVKNNKNSFKWGPKNAISKRIYNCFIGLKQINNRNNLLIQINVTIYEEFIVL